ncbi:Uncharacterised protein [Bordetella pertussis]|nr:Uncharacterised protein [Bordetella pertussis]CFN69132.1 Uncharacterised protein [Bordetella pertussis]CFN71366.1 Uncharacterised protein [Bordetella pertussis]CFN83223.1 Uncharacterised protein [Bordetella pertussis]CFO29462.1 Uncharacterised protein [Bordetella pertussis]
MQQRIMMAGRLDGGQYVGQTGALARDGHVHVALAPLRVELLDAGDQRVDRGGEPVVLDQRAGGGHFLHARAFDQRRAGHVERRLPRMGELADDRGGEFPDERPA